MGEAAGSGPGASGLLFDRSAADGRLHAPTFERNGIPIRDALLPQLEGVPGHIVEIGCGSGQHAAVIAVACPDRLYLPTDIEADHRRSAEAHARAHGLSNVQTPIALDASADWTGEVTRLGPLALVLAINVVHISPWGVAEGLIDGAGRVLGDGGILALYGPFIEPDRPLVESNKAFNASLRARNPAWGIRALTDLDRLAETAGLGGLGLSRLPANTLLVTWRRG